MPTAAMLANVIAGHINVAIAFPTDDKHAGR